MKPKIAYLLTILSLTGCGGGVNTTLSIGGSVATTVTNPTYPFAAAVSTFLQSTNEYTLMATAGADTYQLKWHSEPGVPSMFEGHFASTLNYTNTITKNGSNFAASALTDYFDVVPFKPFGGINHTLGNYDVASNQQLLPSVALPGQSGFINNGVRYIDSSKSQILAASVTSWTLDAVGTSNAWACLNSAITPAGSASVTTESICYKIDTSGNVSAMKIGLTINGQTLNFQ
jgi:hypothetical protein